MTAPPHLKFIYTISIENCVFGDMATSSASASASGYLYQFEYALYRLLHGSPSTVVGIETEDDVTEIVHTPSGIDIKFTQSKFSLQDAGHPVGDRTRNLWHTLHIWLGLAAEHATHNYEFYFLSNKKIPSSALVARLAQAESAPDVQAVIQELRAAALHVHDNAKWDADAVLKYSDEDLVNLIGRIRLIHDDKPNGEGSLRESTIALLQLHDGQIELADMVYQALLGMLVDGCRDAWSAKKPAAFTKDRFARRLQRELIAHTRKRCVERPFHSLPLQEYLNQDHSELKFLRQIEQLGLKKKDWERALHDYWGFYAERVRLREIGEVLPDDWIARNEALHRRWENICDEHEQHERRDHRVYDKTIKAEYHGPLGEGKTTHDYFTTGNYHALVNGEDESRPMHWCELSEESDS
jgi:hypothetical protein